MPKYILAIDQGTTSTRCIVFNHSGTIITADHKEHQQIYPRPGWVEHNPVEIWQKTLEVISNALHKADLSPQDIAAIGITNQRETTVAWNKLTGLPYDNAIVWQDTRTDVFCNQLAADGGQDRLREITGLPLATYFSGPKIRWMLDHVPNLRKDAEKGEALFGNIDTWLIWNLTGGTRGGIHVTDVSNASRTLLMDLKTLQWDEDILSLMEIPRKMLPKITA
ncbi:MAG: FGGY family carbohydrate kinase, partial [Anaerolineaceae bacterium]